MCVYSVLARNTRDARLGETLELHRFPSGAKGFVSPELTDCAVCLPVGSQLLLSDIPQSVRQRFHLGEHESVTLEEGHRHQHQAIGDLIVFSNGSSLWLDHIMINPRQPMTARVQSLRRLAAKTAQKPLPVETETEPSFEPPRPWTPEREQEVDDRLVLTD